MAGELETFQTQQAPSMFNKDMLLGGHWQR